MIQGYFGGTTDKLRPYVVAEIIIPNPEFGAFVGTVHFLVDTGADSTLLATKDAAVLGIDPDDFRKAEPVRGVGGQVSTVIAPATISFGTATFQIPIRILAPETHEQQRAVQFLPSLLGRDIIKQFALFIDQKTNRVLLLETHEISEISDN